MNKPLPTPFHDASDLDGARSPQKARRRGGAGRWALLAMLVGCVALLVVGPAVAQAATGSIEGTVTEFGGAHAGVVGAEVAIYDSTGEFVIESTVTGAGGAYQATGLSGGEYKVQFSDPSLYVTQYYRAQTFDDATLVSVSEGNATEEVNAALQRFSSISGTVTSTVTGGGLEGISVSARNEETGSFYSTSTGANGSYAISDLPPGRYEISFDNNDFENGYLPQSISTTLLEGEAKEFNAALKEGGKISGTVTDAFSHSGLAKIRVDVYHQGEEGYYYSSHSTVTNASGQYTVTGLPTGTYTVGFSWEPSEAEYKACKPNEAQCPVYKYIEQFFNGQPSLATANTVGASEDSTTSGINAAMVPAAPANTAPPVISGSAAVGSLLSCSSGSWTGESVSKLTAGWPLISPFTYQWLRDGAAIAGAASDVHAVQAADVGHGLVCEVGATNYAGHTSARSSTFAVVVPTPVISTSASKLTAEKNATKVSITCAGASCAGSVEMLERTVIKRRRGGKRITKKVTTTLAKGSYALAAGKTGAITLRLTSAGKKKLAHARRHRASGKLLITVSGGKSLEKTVLLSLKK